MGSPTSLCLTRSTQLGGLIFAYEATSIGGFVTLPSSFLKAPKLKPATVIGSELQTVRLWRPPSFDSLWQVPVAAMDIPFGMRNVISYFVYSPKSPVAEFGYQLVRAIG